VCYGNSGSSARAPFCGHQVEVMVTILITHGRRHPHLDDSDDAPEDRPGFCHARHHEHTQPLILLPEVVRTRTDKVPWDIRAKDSDVSTGADNQHGGDGATVA
jgi:hypothetical protein